MVGRVLLIARTVWLEFLRRKDFYVVLILVGLFIAGALVVRIIGVQNKDTARFLMSLGLLSSYALSAVLTAAIAARQLPEEIEKHTLHPLLAKPVSRHEVILGKCVAVVATACTSSILFLLLSWLPAPKLPGQNPAVLVQVGALRTEAISLLGIYAVALSLFLPTSLAALISLTTFFAGWTIVNFVGQFVGRLWSFGEKIVERVSAILPDFSIFEHSQRCIEDSAPLATGVVASIVAYGAVFAAFFYLVAVWSFNRRAL